MEIELTRLTDEERAEVAHRMSERILEELQSLNANLWNVTAALHEYKTKELYKYEGYDTFNDFTEDRLQHISQSTLYKRLAVYEHYVIGLGMNTRDLTEFGDYSKLFTARPHITADNKDELIPAIQPLTRPDARRYFQEYHEEDPELKEAMAMRPGLFLNRETKKWIVSGDPHYIDVAVSTAFKGRGYKGL